VILPGHLAAAWISGSALGADLSGTFTAAMFPDIVDKPIRWILGITPNDRLPAHTLLGWLLTTIIAKSWCGDRFAKGWALGYGAHLACDRINASFNPGRLYLLWPLRRYHYHQGPTGLSSSLRDFKGTSLLFEMTLTLLGGIVFWTAIKPRRRDLERS